MPRMPSNKDLKCDICRKAKACKHKDGMLACTDFVALIRIKRKSFGRLQFFNKV